MSDVQGAEETTVKQEDRKQTQETLTREDVEKMVQSAADRVRTEYSRKLKEVEAEKEEIQKQSMSEKERAAFELEQSRKKNAETAAELSRRELALERATIINEMAIPKDLAQYVQGKDGNEIRVNAANMMKAVEDRVLKIVNERLATSGETPRTGNEPAPQAGDKTGWEKAWAMKPGPEKDAAIAKLFETLKGQQIGT